MFLWIVIVGALCAVFCAYGIGANDVANAFGSSVGARAITLKQAICIAAVCEFSGAVLLGGAVSDTIRKGIANVDAFADIPYVLMFGMLCVLFATGLWLLLATYLELPVSTTHSVVGGVMGMAIVADGLSAVHWWGVAMIAASWVVSPVVTGVIAAMGFAALRRGVLRSTQSLQRSFWVLPPLVWLTFFIITWFMLAEAGKNLHLNELAAWKLALLSCGAGTVAGAACALLVVPRLKQRVASDSQSAAIALGHLAALHWQCAVLKHAPSSAMPSRGVRFTMVNGEEDDGVDSEHGTLLSYSLPASDGQPVALYAAGEGDGGPGALRGGPVGEGEGGPGALQGGPAGEGPSNFEKATAAATRGGRPLGGTGVLGAVARGVHVDVHACVEEDGAVAAVHQNAENFDAATEDSFKYLQVFTAMANSVAHGSNDVANSVGPFAAIWGIYLTGTVQSKTGCPVWVLAMGGAGLVLGLATYGYKIMRTLGVKMAKLSNSRGFVVELSAAAVIIFGSRAAVGLLEGVGGVNWWLVAKVFAGWVVTLLVVGATTGALFALGVYAPSIQCERATHALAQQHVEAAAVAMARCDAAAVDACTPWDRVADALAGNTTSDVCLAALKTVCT